MIYSKKILLGLSILGSLLLILRLSCLPLYLDDGDENVKANHKNYNQCLAYLLISYVLFFFYPPLLWWYPSSRLAFSIPSGISLIMSYALWSSSSESKFFAERPYDFVGSCMCFISASLGVSSIMYNGCQ